MRSRLVSIFALILAGCGSPPQSDFLIAAAADLRFAMDDLAAQFQQMHPEVKVRTIYGSSGQFFRQIEQGAPYDVYCSADMAYPLKLRDAGLAITGSEFQYAVGRIVLWVPRDAPLDIEHLGIKALLDPSILHIAIANPDHAPYGKAAVASMRSLGVYDAVKRKLAYGENVSQTLQYVQLRSAEIGIVALSLALAPTVRETGRFWELPIESYPRMNQGGIISKRTKNPDLSRQFRDFITGKEAGETLRSFGFFLPGTHK